jgi:drug/metabolite transporter (DMT)-like permease
MAAWAALAAAFLVMGGQFAVAKRGLQAGLTSWDIVALRFVGAALPGVAILLWRGGIRGSGLGWRRALVVTVLAGSPYALLIYAGLALAPSGHAAMLVPGFGIVVATLLGAAWVGESHTRTRSVGALTVILGLAILGGGAAAASWRTLGGDVLLAAAGILWGLFTLVIRRWRLDALAATAAFSVLSLTYLPPWALWLTPRVLEVPVTEALLQAAYQGILQTTFAFAGFAFAVRRLGAGTASIGTAIIPVIGTLIAIPVAREWPSASGAVGLGVVCIGMVVANIPGARTSRITARKDPHADVADALADLRP